MEHAVDSVIDSGENNKATAATAKFLYRIPLNAFRHYVCDDQPLYEKTADESEQGKNAKNMELLFKNIRSGKLGRRSSKRCAIVYLQ
ncbi:MAG: hypothetical protein LBS61_02070 [Endomicrobium sp.]|nr:hypothetical protein [Endomicrobium sp.]